MSYPGFTIWFTGLPCSGKSTIALLIAETIRKERGMVEIDDHFKTSVDGIFAIGDCVRGPMLGDVVGISLAKGLIVIFPNFGAGPSNMDAKVVGKSVDQMPLRERLLFHFVVQGQFQGLSWHDGIGADFEDVVTRHQIRKGAFIEHAVDGQI